MNPVHTIDTEIMYLFSCFCRPNFNKPNHQGYHKRLPFSQNAKLLVRQIPPVLNNISKLNEHFSKFGTIVNLQVSNYILLEMIRAMETLDLIWKYVAAEMLYYCMNLF